MLLAPILASASEADLKMPLLSQGQTNWLTLGLIVCGLGLIFSWYYFRSTKKLEAHYSMLQISKIIYETCKSYLWQQGKFLILLFAFIGACVAFYFGYLRGFPATGVLLILSWSVIGILGSYSVAWFGIRVNTLANSRMAFESLRARPLRLLNIPLNAGMSIGVLLICIELMLMLVILLFVPSHYAGACFIGFAIGESLGASALRIAGGIFTKIADIGSDLMKVFFKIKEDDPRNPGVIADCTGDNAGDSVGPTADGFETYGVTGVALISFIALAVFPAFAAVLIFWIFAMRIMMIITSIAAFYINKIYSQALYGYRDKIDFEKPLTSLIWISSILSIAATFAVSYVILGHLPNQLWLTLSAIISCGTLGAALIPEATKKFTSPKSGHVQEIVKASSEGGASLNILAGLVAGFFSAFWKSLIFVGLMFTAFVFSQQGLNELMIYPAIFSFGLVAFGFLGMGPVTIAVDSYGPVTDNAQSVFELSKIEEIPGIKEEIYRNYKFKANFAEAKDLLEANDGAGNTFKATAKPVLIGTAVVGATTMIFSLILIIKNTLGVEPEAILSILNPYTLFGFILGGGIIYWFSGASIQAVSTGAYEATAYIKKNIRLEENADQSGIIAQSKKVVSICTKYAQKGMLNIFIAIFCMTLAIAFFSAPNQVAAVALFVGYLIAIAVVGLLQAVFMANAGGAWDNAKKVVEVDLKQKGTPLHDATIVGDTVGDPFKDTSSVSLNPIIKFTTLFGLLAMEIAIDPGFRSVAPIVGIGFLLIALYFIWRSFYKMRIKPIAAE